MAIISYDKYFKIPELIEKIQAYLPRFNKEKFLQAFKFAESAHRGQMRKDDKTPYIAHPIEVVKILISLHADEDTLISAILHDVPEDTNRTLEEVREFFGEKVAFLVDGITKLSKVYYQNDMPQRQVESLKKLFLHSGEDLRVILIKLADRLHNMQTLGNLDDENKRLRIAGETLEIYVPIANLLGIQDIKSQLEDLCFSCLKPKEYEKLKKNREKYEVLRAQYAENFINTVAEACDENKIEAEITRKSKSLYSIYKKISAIGKTVDDVDHRISIKIVVESIADCYHVLGLIHGNFVPINDRFRDYIANPKNNGYQSLHTTVFGIEGVLTEIQIKTKEMDSNAEYGIAANFFEDNTLVAEGKRAQWVNRILEIEKNQQTNEEFMNNIKADIFEDRIFVFSPTGMPIDLPKGATVLDFAYSIEDDVGNHAFRADINGKIKPISAALKTGDVVKVLLSKKNTPELSWLSLVKTNRAKNGIAEYFKKMGRSKKIAEGFKMLQKHFDIVGAGMVSDINFKKIKAKIQKDFGKEYDTMDDLYAAIAEGEIRTSDVVKYIGSTDFEKFEGKPVRVILRIVAKNRFGLLRDISEILYNNVLDMYTLKGWASKYETNAFFSVEILVPNLDVLSHIFDEIEQVEGVTDIYRLSSKGLLIFSIVAFFTTCLWVAHGFIIRVISQSSFESDHPFFANLLINFGLLLMITTVLYISNLGRKYFPLMRNRKLLWVFTFIIPVVATVLLFMEMVYFNLKLSWLTTLTEICFVYIYLLINYMHFVKSRK
ncbi:bifunctional (p)ppGpp synthetase/guanosine-3',5'-bis(diphosphate) 3'-pyrophosphohydrolase [Candidatus Peregrinibacteria bacterium]|nr:bifunctional (p)ppGpp synthetase/guanosine-3',5'-bis(diphosphate) 3'-pyrophosphohydrolase [Candidatus Peregrinibacteria bacterium]